MPITAQTQFTDFPHYIVQPVSYAGGSLSLHAPHDGRVLATMLALPASRADAEKPHAMLVESESISHVAEFLQGGSYDWFTTTPEGYFDCSANAAEFIKWNVNGELYPAERYLRRSRRPDLVRKALRGERITAPAMTGDDIPPAVRFLSPLRGDTVQGDFVNVVVETRDERNVKEVELFINDRPLPPQHAKPTRMSPPSPLRGGVGGGVDPNHRFTRQFTFRVPLPRGVAEIRLRALAYDDTDLGSEAAQILIKRLDAKPVPGDLYVLSIGISEYKGSGFGVQGSESGVQGSAQIKNLRYPANDARAIARRFALEGRSPAVASSPRSSGVVAVPLYERVFTRVLTNEQATLANVRAGLKWLRDSARPGQVDTVILFLAGHGFSQDGKYYFATHDVNPRNIPTTSLSGAELREALDGRLQARVFLFVDTCHAGGLQGSNHDLALQLDDRVYLLASSGAKEYSYESAQWGHGAFTLALLRALDDRKLARDGLIHFNALAFAVPDQVAELMKQANRNESEQEPCVPLAGRSLRVPIAAAR